MTLKSMSWQYRMAADMNCHDSETIMGIVCYLTYWKEHPEEFNPEDIELMTNMLLSVRNDMVVENSILKNWLNEIRKMKGVQVHEKMD